MKTEAGLPDTLNRVLIVSPFETPDHRLVADAMRAGAFAFLDVGRDWPQARAAIERVQAAAPGGFGLRLPEGVHLDESALAPLRGRVNVLMHAAPAGFQALPGFFHLVQVVSLEEALEAQRLGADGLILKGAESGGRVGAFNSFILLQQTHGRLTLPYWAQGGMGPHGAAAAVLAGAQGVLYDSQLALMPAAQNRSSLHPVFRAINGSETAVAGGYRFLRHKLLPDVDDETGREQLLARMKGADAPLLAGEDLALAQLFHALYGDVAGLVHATEEAIAGHLRQAARAPLFGADTAFAKEYGLRYPLVQGPMAQVSDRPGFAAAVADAGAMPSIALALLPPERARPILEQTREHVGGKPWCVGLLGFLPPELYKAQAELVLAMAPSHVILAGGRPDQARIFEQHGVKAFLHCPTTGLFERFLADGARRFVFEGRECGGHVGPLSSMTLWEGQIARALESEACAELSLLFAGGLHDRLSGALLAAMCAPLAALGAKIGISMGTAYLFTGEAVREGAIVAAYQELAVASNETALVQTRPGHVTRCLRTPYVDFLEQERLRLRNEGKSRDEIFLALEQMNAGHLRIASKGSKRIDGVATQVDAGTQLSEGMYMIGDVACLRQQVLSIAGLHEELAASAQLLRQYRDDRAARAQQRGAPCDIAIVGMAGIFPGALTAQQFWANIIEGKDSVTEVPDTRWSKALYYDPKAAGARGEKTNSKWGGFVPDFHFDPGLFGIPPQSLGSIDPAQIAGLLVAYQALQDAGYLERGFNRERTSVIFGIEPGADISGAYGLRIMLPQLLDEPALGQALDGLPRLTEDSFSGVLGNVVSGRISNRLDLGGQNFTVDAACASSLAAIDAAIKELRYGESDVTIAGGVDFHNGIHDYLMFSSTHALSGSGRCRSFSETADGIALGEGAGAVVLKRYEDALCDGDHVYAVIRGIGGASDGKSLGLTAPRRQGQQRALNRAYRRAGISPAEIGLLEAHGTGTVVGDRTELATMETVFSNAGSARAACALGSVKTQIGHTKCAAGIASLIKSAYAVEQGLLPPTLHLEQPNAYYRQERSAFYFPARTMPWLEQERKAGVSAFGFGGTNYHLVLDRGDADKVAAIPSAPQVWPCELLLFRGHSFDQARQQVERLQAWLAAGHQDRLCDIAYSHHLGNEGEGPVRLAVVAASVEELGARLARAAQGQADPLGVHVGDGQPLEGQVAFLFPGQGSQFPGMGADLFTYFPATRAHLAGEPALCAAMFPSGAFSDQQHAAQQAALTDTRMAQPALAVVSQAAAQVLRELGIEASHLAGHSFGELSALCHAGSIPAGSLVPVSRQRADCILGSFDGEERGAMLAVEGDAALVHAVLGELGELDISNMNAPRQTVLAGPGGAIAAALQKCKQGGVRARILPVACAFHSRALAPAAAHFGAFLRQVPLAPTPTATTVWSNQHAAPYPDGMSADALADCLGRQIAAPVRFEAMIRAMHAHGVRTFVEVGAGGALCSLVNNILDGEEVQALPLLLRDAPPLKGLMNTLARLATLGAPMAPGALYANRRLRRLDLAHPKALAPTMWSVNGHHARPLHGKLPAHAYDPAPGKKLALAPVTARPAPLDDGPRAAVMRSYFDSVNHFVQQQRDVMLGYLGAAPAPLAMPLTVATPLPAALPVAAVPAIPAIPAVPLADRAAIERKLRVLICQRTGYPEEMIELDLDLEADLGIDSIKRVELLSEIGKDLGVADAGTPDQLGDDAAQFLEEVSRIKTLRGISAWLADYVGRNAESVAPEPAAPVTYDRSAIEARLKALICARTGYPDEMIDADLDLEADLGIDSIKRVELLSEIGKELGLAGTGAGDELGDDAAQFLEQVSKIKTLRGISAWLADYSKPEQGPAVAPEPESGAPSPSPAVPLRVLDVLYSAQPLQPSAPARLAGKTLHCVGASAALYDALRRQLDALGARLEPLQRGALQTGLQLDTNGILYFNRDDDAYQDVLGLFHALRACDARDMDTVMTIQDDPAPLRHPDGSYHAPSCGSGASGMLVSLRWEWPKVPMIRPLILHDAARLDCEALAARILGEILSQPEILAQPVAYCDGVRHVRKALPRPSYVASTEALRLEPEAVVVIVGGARGITSWFASAFAERYRCRLVLLGRSPLPAGAEPFPGVDTAPALRQALLARQDGAARARDIEATVNAILADKQMRRTMEELDGFGSEILYLQADVTEPGQVDGALREVMARYDRIDGVLFGAGILDDRFLKDKQEASLARVYHTKASGVENVLDSLDRLTEPSFVVFFSSISATLGNRGQTDYSAANAYLDKRAMALNASRNGHYLSVNWGPWEGAGMIDETLQKHLEGMGIHAISRRQGVDFLFDELGAGKRASRLIATCVKDEALFWSGEIA
ncbi:SDR family NAD(P)-dependent oxidoreductase [Duganella sp. FT92W]|uniref:SDR family NAD(P)-dependent oxidoreductase n=1 Tax=Pseudoduganella rivuli TaxID=2666085 RepID=A0A7X2IL15_9BURK|nr:type I polyketide synthase [Pseudoduganella rivuli]MRV71683.1 SDR family NAD(P)-dependent oxidoreductase [Pseudoduganella rivuli]